MNPQLWLSLDGICNVLRTHEGHIKWLVDRGYIEMLPGQRSGLKSARFLDPTPHYADRLRIAEMLYRRRMPLPADMDISEKAIFTRSEIAVILGWSDSYARQYLKEHKLPVVKIGGGKTGGLNLYTAKTVRELLWRRRGRKLSAQKSPFLIRDLIEFFLKHEAEASQGLPTDADLADDESLQKKLAAVLKLPEAKRHQAMVELWGKVELAKTVAPIIRAGAPSSPPAHDSAC